MRLRRDGECSRCSAAPARQTALPHSFVRLEFSLLHFNHPLSVWNRETRAGPDPQMPE